MCMMIFWGSHFIISVVATLVAIALCHARNVFIQALPRNRLTLQGSEENSLAGWQVNQLPISNSFNLLFLSACHVPCSHSSPSPSSLNKNFTSGPALFWHYILFLSFVVLWICNYVYVFVKCLFQQDPQPSLDCRPHIGPANNQYLNIFFNSWVVYTIIQPIFFLSSPQKIPHLSNGLLKYIPVLSNFLILLF